MPYQKSQAVAAFASQRIEDLSGPVLSTTKTENLRKKLDPKLAASIEALQHNYEKNLGVIEKLYEDQRKMQSKINLLEAKLHAKEGNGKYIVSDDSYLLFLRAHNEYSRKVVM